MEENSVVRSLARPGNIRIAWFVSQTERLGPSSRTALWLQGCNRNCKGCISPEMQDPAAGREISISELTEMVLTSDTDGITISGGEPFYQADRLLELLVAVKRSKPDLGVVIYTGYRHEELELYGGEAVLRLLREHVDVLIDGEYIIGLDDNCGLRGSSNQRVIFFTEKYTAYKEQFGSGSARQADFFLRGRHIQMVGVPSAATKAAISKVNRSISQIICRRNVNTEGHKDG